MASNDFELRDKHKKSPWGRHFSNEFNSYAVEENGYSSNSNSRSDANDNSGLKNGNFKFLNPFYLNECILVMCKHKNCGKGVKAQSFTSHITDYHQLSIAEYAKEVNVNSAHVDCDRQETNYINNKSKSVRRRQTRGGGGDHCVRPLDTNNMHSKSNLDCGESNAKQLDCDLFNLVNEQSIAASNIPLKEMSEPDIQFEGSEKDSLSSFNGIVQSVPNPLVNNRKRSLECDIQKRLLPSTMKMKKPTLDPRHPHASSMISKLLHAHAQEFTAASQLNNESVDSVYSSLNLESLSNLTLQEINEKDENSIFQKHVSDLVRKERELFSSSSSSPPSETSNKLPATVSLTSSTFSVSASTIHSLNQLSSHCLTYSNMRYHYPDQNGQRLWGHHQGMSPLHFSGSHGAGETSCNKTFHSPEMQHDNSSVSSHHAMDNAEQSFTQRVRTQRMMALHSKRKTNSHEKLNQIPETFSMPKSSSSSPAYSEWDQENFLKSNEGSAPPNCSSSGQHDNFFANDFEDLAVNEKDLSFIYKYGNKELSHIDEERAREKPCFVDESENFSCADEKENEAMSCDSEDDDNEDLSCVTENENLSSTSEKDDDSDDDWWEETPPKSSNRITMTKPKVRCILLKARPPNLGTQIGSGSNNMRKEVGVGSFNCTSVSEDMADNSIPGSVVSISPVKDHVKTSSGESNCTTSSTQVASQKPNQSFKRTVFRRRTITNNPFKFHAFYPLLSRNNDMRRKATARDQQLRKVWLPDPSKEPFISNESSSTGPRQPPSEFNNIDPAAVNEEYATASFSDNLDKCDQVAEQSGSETSSSVIINTSENGATKLHYPQAHSSKDEEMVWNDVPERESEKRPFSEVEQESSSAESSSTDLDNPLNRKRPRSDEDSEKEWMHGHRNNSIPNGS